MGEEKLKDDLFANNPPQEEPQQEEKAKAPNPIGVRLTRQEIDQLQRLADKYGVARNALLKKAVLHYIEGVNAGEIKIKTKTTNTLV